MSDKPLIVNELLAFLQVKLDEVSAIQICSKAFLAKDICAARETLFQSLNLSVKNRRREDSGKKYLQDIIKVLKETDPDDVPTFVAKNVNKLPSVSYDHVDAVSMQKDSMTLKKC